MKKIKRWFGIFLDLVEPQGRIKRLIHSVLNPGIQQVDYAKLIAQRVLTRLALYPAKPQPGLISFTTTVWDTPHQFLVPFVESVLAQKHFGSFEWILLDNGSAKTKTIEYLKKIARENPEIRLLRVEKNIGIILGNRMCLEAAAGDYIVPLDSDDYLYPDTLQILTASILKGDRPPLLYSDEDKLFGRALKDPYFKPEWDPALFLESCYIAHVCAIHRELALKLDVYSDTGTNGSHDWDTFCRFLASGYQPIHIPEVLYSWRMHFSSTAMNLASKDYIRSSQLAVLHRFLKLKNLDDLLEVIPSPYFEKVPHWRIRVREAKLNLKLTLISVAMDEQVRQSVEQVLGPYPGRVSGFHEVKTGENLQTRISEIVEEHLDSHYFILNVGTLEAPPSDWWTELESTRLLFSDMVMLGGRVHDGGKISSAAYFFGLNDFVAAPDHGKSVASTGYHGQLLKRQSVDALSPQFLIVEARFLKDFLKSEVLPESWGPEILGLSFGLFAKKLQRRVVYSPYLLIESKIDFDRLIANHSVRHWAQKNKSLFASRYYPRHLGREPKSYYTPSRLLNLKNERF